MKSITFVLLILLSNMLLAETFREIRVPKISNARDMLIVDILKKVLAAEDVKANIIEQSELNSDNRITEDVRSGKLSLSWAGMGPDREQILRPVRIPIFKGIQGHRIFCIRPESQSKLRQVKNLSDLKQFKAGSGMGWGDTFIVEEAGIPIVTTTKGVNLWPMLDGGRFDYFPLAIHEPWSEIESRPELSLTVEKNLLLVYPFAMYFYVNSNDKKLHDLIYSGMNKMIDDGSYDRMLFSASMFKSALISADVSERTVIRIPNPFMHPDTPVDEAKYWLDPKKLSLADLKSL